ncbi:hypothetical protein [Saccharolobus islandicus]|nr:hypothetical protein [Sulfolobus islandicus]
MKLLTTLTIVTYNPDVKFVQTMIINPKVEIEENTISLTSISQYCEKF